MVRSEMRKERKKKDNQSIEIKSRYDCCGCAACRSRCPAGAIAMRPDTEGFLYPHVDKAKCIECGACRRVCPIIAPPKKHSVRTIAGCYAADPDKQRSASSGAFFSLLGECFLTSGGLVCGAVFDRDFKVRHLLTERREDLALIRGTKYVQSETGTVFSEIEEKLKAGKSVLFCGTPCQAAGLKKYLGKDCEGLLCVDIVCHGVPSPAVWLQYLREKFAGRNITEINFRDKSRGSAEQQITFHMEDGERVSERSAENMYMRGFLRNYYVRPSCFQCRFKGFDRCTDLTIGDYWSVEEFHPGFSNGLGVSAVMIRSAEGKKWFDRVSDRLRAAETGKKQILTWNECLTDSVTEPPEKETFFAVYKEKGVEETVRMLLETEKNREDPKPTFRQKIRKFIRAK